MIRQEEGWRMGDPCKGAETGKEEKGVWGRGEEKEGKGDLNG